MLVFAALVPHPIISVPEIGKRNTKKLPNTIKAYKELSQELYAAKPDVILIISSHTEDVPGAFTINQRPELIVEFSKFGDLSDKIEIKNSIAFGYRIKESIETTIPIVLTDNTILDYRPGIAIYHLTSKLNLENLRIVDIGTSNLSLKKHLEFGYEINRQINLTTNRVAVLAVGNLAHNSIKEDGFELNINSEPYNKLIYNSVRDKNLKTLLDLKDEDISKVNESTLRPLLILLGVIDKRDYSSNILSYESGLGFSCLAAKFDLRS